MNNITISVRINQVKNKSICLTPGKIYDTARQMLESDVSLTKVYNEIIRLYNCYGPSTHPSQAKIAFNCGMSREWVNKCIKRLCDLGLLFKKRVFIQGKETACVYWLPKVLQDLNVRYNLSSLLPALKWSYMPVYLRQLLASCKTKIVQFTPYNNYYIKKDLKISSDKNKSIKNSDKVVHRSSNQGNVMSNYNSVHFLHDNQKISQEIKQARQKDPQELKQEFKQAYKNDPRRSYLSDIFAKIIYTNLT